MNRDALTLPRERPILFQGDMVRALLAGTKTQTRRTFKLPRGHNWDELQGGMASGNIEADRWPGTWHASEFRCPYGQAGDRLWVRERWNTSKNVMPSINEPYIYGADLGPTGVSRWAARWRPSIHMPRVASRILLEVTEVRLERLQNISRSDAMDEGHPFPNMAQGADPRKWYADLWNSINGDGSWDANPWVWAVSFRVALP